jgi:sortase A
VAVISRGDEVDTASQPQPPRWPAWRGQAAVSLPSPSGSRPARPALPDGAAVSAWFLGALSVVAVWFLLYAFMFSGFQESSAQHSLYSTLRGELAQETAPLGGNIRLGQPIAILQIPQAGVNDVVLEGATAGVLENGPGLQSASPLPGQPGTSLILGRQFMFGGPFQHLSVLRKGDLFQVTTGQGTFTYVVQDVRYFGSPKPPALAAGASRITLVTSAGSGWHDLGDPNQLLYVDAMLKGTAVGAPSGRPTAILASEKPMHSDTSVLMPLVLWLQLLLIVVVGVAWTRSRWSHWQTWLVAVPLILAVLWAVSETAFQLLPNLI